MSSDFSLDILSSDDPVFSKVRQLLRNWSLDKYLARKPPCSVVTLTSNATCGQALRTLALHRISSAPVFSAGVCLGFLDVSDVLRALLTIVSIRELTEDSKDFQLRSAGLQLEHQQLHSLHLAQDGALIYKADLHSTLHDVILYGFLQPNAAGQTQVVHRVGVFEDSDGDVSDDDMTDSTEPETRRLHSINVTHVISQSDVMQFLARHVDDLGPLADVSVRRLGLADKSVVCVPAEMSTIHAFASMMANKVSCVGVVSHQQGGGLAASLSSSDLRGLLPEHFVALGAPVLQYLTSKSSAAWATQQHHTSGALAGCLSTAPHHGRQALMQQPQQQQLGHQQFVGSAQAWGLKGGEGLKAPELVSCNPDSSLRELLLLMSSNNLHRVHVLDDQRRPVSLITITDLLRVIVGATELLEARDPEFDLDQDIEQQSCGLPDCSMGVTTGQELIESGGLVPVRSSQALMNTA